MLLVPTFIASSRIHGLGLFAAAPIEEGETIWSYSPIVDVLIPVSAFEELPPVPRAFIEVYAYRPRTEPWHYVLNTDDGRFMNHSAQPNTVTIGDHVRAKFAIAEGDEITTDYAEFMHPDDFRRIVPER